MTTSFKSILALLLLFCLSLFGKGLFAQNVNEPFGTGFSKSNRKSIETKFNSLLMRVAEENNFQKESITYTIQEKYTVFYTKPNRHLPKVIIFSCNGKSVKYKHLGLSGAVLHWLLGSWVVEK